MQVGGVMLSLVLPLEVCCTISYVGAVFTSQYLWQMGGVYVKAQAIERGELSLLLAAKKQVQQGMKFLFEGEIFNPDSNSMQLRGQMAIHTV